MIRTTAPSAAVRSTKSRRWQAPRASENDELGQVEVDAGRAPQVEGAEQLLSASWFARSISPEHAHLEDVVVPCRCGPPATGRGIADCGPPRARRQAWSSDSRDREQWGVFLLRRVGGMVRACQGLLVRPGSRWSSAVTDLGRAACEPGASVARPAALVAPSRG